MDHTQAGICEAASQAAPRLSVGGLFVEALARQDFAVLACCLDTGVRLRTLLPRGSYDLVGRDDVAAWFRSLFGGPDSVELADLLCSGFAQPHIVTQLQGRMPCPERR